MSCIRRFLQSWLVVCALGMAGAAAGAAAADAVEADLTPAEMQRVMAGTPVIRTLERSTSAGRTGTSVAYGLIKAPPSACWEDVNNYDAFVRLTPGLKRVTILERDKNTALVWQQMDVPIGVFSFTLQVLFGHAQRRLSWTLDKTRPSDLADVQGSIAFGELPNGQTLVRCSVLVDSGFWTPAFVGNWLVKRDMPALVANVTRSCEAHAARTQPVQQAAPR